MKIVTWNINGLRTFKGTLRETLDNFNADVLALQETKTNRATLEADLACVAGYNSYFAFPRVLTGYSGVATFSSDDLRPFAVNELLQKCPEGGIEDMDPLVDVPCPSAASEHIDPKDVANVDAEGRCIASLYKFSDKKGCVRSLVIFNLYCPRNDPDRPERAEVKHKFNAMLEYQARNLVAKGYDVIFAGDMNISHKRIDNCEPYEDFELAPERMWMDKLLDSSNGVYFVDVFRHFHPLEKDRYTCWNSQKSARLTNFGTRIDYILCNAELLEYFISCDIHPEVMGSDHCPVSAVLGINEISAEKLPRNCTRFWPEFAGTQTSLKAFLIKTNLTQPLKPLETAIGKKRPADTQPKLNAFFAKRTKSSSGDKANTQQVEKEEARLRKNSEQIVPKDSSRAEQDDASKCGKALEVKGQLSNSWKKILKGPPQAPPCSGHGETSVMRIVKKDGPNKGRKFFCCARPEGAASNKEARCQFFVWI